MHDHTIRPRIHISFRFHVNFYHSYRGDSPDETGFGKDIRIIRGIIGALDDFNKRGVPVRGTWDFDNYFSLETIIPTYCPDLIDSWQRRVSAGVDEINIMSYNNGIVTAHTEAEFLQMFRLTLSNEAGSGLNDLFETVRPVVRPQEMMFTPAHIGLYRRCGVEAVSLFYSAVPFNTFSNFIPKLPLAHRFNPLTLTYSGIDDTIVLLPAYNHGDIGEYLSLAAWIRKIYRRYGKQLEANRELPQDLLLIIDLDADDDFWAGVNIPVVKSLLSTMRGFRGMIESIIDLPYVYFTTPWSYLETHKPVATVEIRQDTADGGFDGYSSWAEKSSNHRLWSGIEKSRIFENRARRLAMEIDRKSRDDVESHLANALSVRIKAMSTTHFGLSMPVMNVHRLRNAARLVDESVEHSKTAYLLAESRMDAVGYNRPPATFHIVDCREPAAESSAPQLARYLVRLKTRSCGPAESVVLTDDSGKRIPCGFYRGTPTELCFVTQTAAGEIKDFTLTGSNERPESPTGGAAIAGTDSIGNGLIELTFDSRGNPCRLIYDSELRLTGRLFGSAVRYGAKLHNVEKWEETASLAVGNGVASLKTLHGRAKISNAAEELRVEREYLVARGLPYLYITTRVHYPQTHPKRVPKAKSRKLGREFDRRWKEVMPCEIGLPPPAPGKCYRVWKQNFLNHVSCYDLDYHRFSRNRNLWSFNNHLTHAWVGVTDGERGLLIAQSTDYLSCFAFCPMRTRMKKDRQSLFLNPFGTYYGPQLKYQTAYTGIGKTAALLLAEHLESAAPSYSGVTETHRLLIAPYAGDAPPQQLRFDALAFSEPPAIIGSEGAG